MPGSETPRSTLVGVQGGLPSGLPGTWATALATLAVLLMLAALLWIVAVNAFGWFWPARISEIVLDDGTVRIGEIVAREPIPSAGKEVTAPLYRVKLKTGNRELTRADFMWIDEAAIAARSRPDDLVRVVRSEYGDAFGRIARAYRDDGTAIEMGSPRALDGLLETGEEWRREHRRLEKERERVRRPLTRLEERLDLYTVDLRKNKFEVEVYNDVINELAQAEAKWFRELTEKSGSSEEKLKEQIEKLQRQ